MFSKGRKKGQTRFAYTPANSVKSVALCGDFTDWQPQTMRKQKTGQYVCNIDLEPGEYQYKFLVDGDWVEDPDNEAMAPNEHGSMNSVAVVG